MFQFTNPLQPASTDSGKQREFWKLAKERKAFVPFCNGSNALPKVFRDLSELSPSYAAAVRWICTMAFGGDMGTLDITNKPRPGFAVKKEDNDLDDTEKETFIEELELMGISLLDIVRLTNKLEKLKIESGNNYLRIKGYVMDGVIRIKFSNVHYLHAAYVQTGPRAKRYIAVCKSGWKFDENDSLSYEKIPVSYIGQKFNWKTNKKGETFETIVHSYNDLDENEWYGQPWIRSVLNWMYSEFAQGELRCKTDSTEVTAKKVGVFKKELDDFEFCDECDEGELNDGTKCKCTKDKRSAIEIKADAFREITTNEGGKPGSKKKKEAKSIALLEVHDEFPQFFDLMINRDTAWFKEGLEQAAFKISSVLGVPRELVDSLQGKSGQGGMKDIALYLKANCQTIEPTQKGYENYWGWIFGETFSFVGRDDLKKYGIKFNDKITPLVEALRAANSTNEQVNNKS